MAITPAVRLGVVFTPERAPELLRDFAVTADEAGVDDLWFWEDCFKEAGIGVAAAALAWTRRLRVGIGLMPVPLRNVALMAMELATLSRLFPNRLLAGIGHGVQDWMAQAGVRPESPMTLLREYTGALRALLDGESVTTSGRYVSLDAVRLDWPPTAPTPLGSGGFGPKSLAYAATNFDATLVAAPNPAEAHEVCRRVLRYRADAGLTDPHEVVVTQQAATGPDAQARVGDAGLGGRAADVAAFVRRLAESGATTVVLQPTSDERDLLGFIRFLGEEVRPLVLA